MDTPRTNLGDATYLSRAPPDFDMTQEPSFQSPGKDHNVLQQLRDGGRGPNLRTPRGSRAPLSNKLNLGTEFTPMLKSATRNSARRRSGKENGLATPALGKINEDMDMTNVPVESSLFGPSRNLSSITATPLPEVDSGSEASTPIVMQLRHAGNNKGPLHDGNQLSLREQENVIDRIEKENFGLKLKIHFLEEALRKAGPGFSEAALKENTELKVDKVTMQRELSRYRKHLATAEKDLETYQQQILDVQQKAKKKYADESQEAENNALRQTLKDQDAEIQDLKQQLERQDQDHGRTERLQDEIGDLQADLREKDRDVTAREDEIDELKAATRELEEKWTSAQERITELEDQQTQPNEYAGKLEELREKIGDLEADLREKDHELNERDEELNELEEKLNETEENWNTAKQRVAELEESAQSNDDLAEARETIDDLEARIRRFEEELDDMKADLQQAVADKNRAEGDLEELQDEMSNKSLVTKGLSRQVEEKISRLQSELARSQEKCEVLERQVHEKEDVAVEIKSRAQQLLQQRESWDRERGDLLLKLEDAQRDLAKQTDEKHLLQLRQDTLNGESTAFQRDISRLQRQVNELQGNLDREKSHSMQIQRDLRANHQSEVDRLNDDIANLRGDNSRFGREASSGKDSSSSMERQIAMLQERCTELEGSLSQEKAKSSQSQRDVNEKQSEISRLQDDIADLQDEQGRLRKEASGGQSASASMEREISRLRNQISEMKVNLDQEKSNGHQIERETRLQLQPEIDRLKNQVSNLQADLREKDNLHRGNTETWETARRNLESQRDRLEERTAGLQRSLDRLRDAEGTSSSKAIQDALHSEAERHKTEEAVLSRQIDDLRGTLDSKQSMLASLRDEISAVRSELRQCQLDYQAQAEKVEALEDEVEVLQATLDEESEDASNKLAEADQMCQHLRRQLEQARRDQQSEQIGHINNAERVVDDLREQLEKTEQKLHESKRELARAKKEAKRANIMCDDLRCQLEQTKDSVGYDTPVYRDLREKLERVRGERAAYRASAQKLQSDCDRLKQGAEEALAWIQARNAESAAALKSSVSSFRSSGGPKARFQYGDMILDVVDQKDHEAVIRAADTAQRRHDKEIRGMALQMEWMQARWERESKLRHDGAFAKKYLSLQLEIADACNKADLRILRHIHKELGIKSPDAMLARSKQKPQKPVNNLRVFAIMLRSVARMSIAARQWGKHEQTRKRLAIAWDEAKQNDRT